MVINKKTKPKPADSPPVAKKTNIKPIIYGSREDDKNGLIDEQQLSAQEITQIKHDVLEEIGKPEAKPKSSVVKKLFKKPKVLKKKFQFPKLPKILETKKPEAPKEVKIPKLPINAKAQKCESAKLPRFKSINLSKLVKTVLKAFGLFLIFWDFLDFTRKKT